MSLLISILGHVICLPLATTSEKPHLADTAAFDHMASLSRSLCVAAGMRKEGIPQYPSNKQKAAVGAGGSHAKRAHGSQAGHALDPPLDRQPTEFPEGKPGAGHYLMQSSFAIYGEHVEANKGAIRKTRTNAALRSEPPTAEPP
jgi:hypothetical protein